MSVFVKGKLKAARDALGKKDYASAKDAAEGVLEYEPDNYNANVFLGLALFELGEFDKSEQVYRKAIDANPEQLQAWQGLRKLYERAESWTKFAETLQHVAQLFLKANDATKCAEALQKYIDLRKERGSRVEIAEALMLLLPDSPFYPLLSTLPPPDATNPTASPIFFIQSSIQNSLPVIEEIVDIFEKDESETMKKEIDKRRQRLGAAGPEQIRRDVSKEIMGSSKLPILYDEIMAHPNASDELRRATESKLLRYKQQLLFATPSTPQSAEQKSKLVDELQDLVNGMVLLGIPDELAWSIFIETQNVEKIEDYDIDNLRRYIHIFPSLPLAKLLSAYYTLFEIPLHEKESDKEDKKDQEQSEDALLDAIVDAFADLPSSLIAHRIVAELYEHDADYENAMKVAENGLELVRQHEKNFGKPIEKVRRGFNVILATSLVHLFPPKHHARALGIIDSVLQEDPKNVSCLMGRAYILQQASKFKDAADLFSQVSDLTDQSNLDLNLRAREEFAWCTSKLGDNERAASLLKSVLDDLEDIEDREIEQARCWWKLGQCHWNSGDESRELAYQAFITALKRSSTFAPAFTSLGIYYSDYVSPPDPKRASKCFQKAFELDPREAEAARRLAEGFAEEQEWDLVEVVSRRTIEGEGGLEGGADSAAKARYLPLNAWAWKAIGVVELNRHRFDAAIEAFQVALRTDVDDHLSWLRLGEAYSKAGRYVAALKALHRAEELDADDWICSYLIGDVQRQLGLFTEAIQIFSDLLVTLPSELSVLMSLAQTHFDLGLVELSTGFIARAEFSFVTALRVALRSITSSTGTGYSRIPWKTVADSLFKLSQIEAYSDPDDVREILTAVVAQISQPLRKELVSIVSAPSNYVDKSGSELPLSALEAAICSYDYRTTFGGLDDQASGSAVFDLGIALRVYANRISTKTSSDVAQIMAVKTLKESISFDPINDQYWVGLANAVFITQPRLAQHAYVRALDINSKNCVTWTNLGLFYLHNGDAELANESFYKAQVLDPDYSLAWVGQSLVAIINGHEHEATALLEHAVGLPYPASSADFMFATRLFTKLNANRKGVTSEAMQPAFFVLDRFVRLHPQNYSALHLFALACETIGHLELGIDLLGRTIALLEAAYEESENPVVERQFSIAHINLARLSLAAGEYEAALESYQQALGLLPEELTDSSTRVLVAQSHFGSGIASFKLGMLQEAIVSLETALRSAGDDSILRGHTVILLAQVLWAVGTDEGRESAKDQLLQSIQTDPDNLLAINTLAGMGILTEDDSLIDAALSEILSLPLPGRRERDPAGEVGHLLVLHHLSQGDIKQALSVAEKDVVAEPSKIEARSRLASLLLQQGDVESKQAISALISENNVQENRDTVELSVVGVAGNEGAGPEALSIAQRGIMLTPWKEKNWQTLSYVVARSSS
ncbi:hypothetical protein ABKN59_002079 [Abortiporus biennis]